MHWGSDRKIWTELKLSEYGTVLYVGFCASYMTGCVCENSSKQHVKKSVLFYITYTSVHLTIKQTKRGNLNEGRNWDKFNEPLNVAFILGATAEWESMSFKGLGV